MTRAPTWPARALGAALAVVIAGSASLPASADAAPTVARAGVARTPLQLRVVGERWPVVDARVTAQRIGGGPPLEVVVPAAAEGGEASVLLELEAGVWSLIVRAPRHAPVQRVLTITRGGAPEPVSLTLPTEKVPVQLRVGPPAAVAAGVVWTLRHAEGGWGDMFTADGASERRSLEPGRWHIRASAPGFVDRELEWTVGEPGPALELQPEAAPPPPRPRPAPTPAPVDPRLGLGLGLGTAGAVSLGLGVGLLVQHRDAYAAYQAAPGNQAHVAAVSASSAGAGLVGAGLGLGVVALSAGLFKAADRVLWAEFAVGGGVALIGSAWYAKEWQDVQKDLYDGNKDPDMDGVPSGHDHKSRHRETAAASFIGAGAGLMLGAGAALLTRALIRLRRARPSSSAGARWGLAGGPGQLGLGLRGRF